MIHDDDSHVARRAGSASSSWRGALNDSKLPDMRISGMTLLAVLAVGAGCVNGSAAATTVADVPASQLSIEPSIIDSDPTPSDGMMPVVVQFFHGNEFVQLANTLVTCNGVTLPWGSLGYAARVPVPAAGSTMVFTHVKGGTTTMATIKVPSRPVLTSPTAGAMLTRTTNLAIAYVPSTSAGVRPDASDSTTAVNGSEQSETGTAYLDVSMLHPGTGTVSVARRFVSLPTATGFQGVVVTYTISSPDTAVTWQ